MNHSKRRREMRAASRVHGPSGSPSRQGSRWARRHPRRDAWTDESLLRYDEEREREEQDTWTTE